MTTSAADPKPLSRSLVLLMAMACGAAVASNYYAQPLLHTIAEQFGLSFARAGTIVTVAQLGYAAGLLLLVPLGDRFEQRALIVSMTLLSAFGLVMTALSNSLPWLLLGTALTGLFSVVAQMMVPFAATLAAPAQRGRAVGTVMSGLLLGILLARTVAGALSSLGDWRTVYWAAAVLMVATSVALARALPRCRPVGGLSYAELLASVATLCVQEPVLRLRAALGAVAFAIFSMLWTTIAFLLAAPPYRYSDALIGLFGLAGAAGALAASQAGRLADRGQGALATTLGLVLLLASWLPLAFAQRSLAALLVGVLVLDLAVQLVHVSNQNAVFALRPEIRNRLNAGYMTSFFIGGAAGSLGAAALFGRYGWSGVSAAGAALSLFGVGLWFGLREAPDADR